MRSRCHRAVVLIGALVFSGLQSATAGELRVAVAANFAATLQELATNFGAATGHQVTIIPGSTGKHYAQIMNGAPFDVFFAADAARPALLDQSGRVPDHRRRTYAIGRLILWSADSALADQGSAALEGDDFRYLAIANPRLAPYGKAAQQVLVRMKLWDKLQPQLVRGENINQTFQFVYSGNAQLGFIAKSQLVSPHAIKTGSYWEVPAEWHEPILQQAVLLSDSATAREFMDYSTSAAARQIIQRYGYDLPPELAAAN